MPIIDPRETGLDPPWRFDPHSWIRNVGWRKGILLCGFFIGTDSTLPHTGETSIILTDIDQGFAPFSLIVSGGAGSIGGTTVPDQGPPPQTGDFPPSMLVSKTMIRDLKQWEYLQYASLEPPTFFHNNNACVFNIGNGIDRTGHNTLHLAGTAVTDIGNGDMSWFVLKLGQTENHDLFGSDDSFDLDLDPWVQFSTATLGFGDPTPPVASNWTLNLDLTTLLFNDPQGGFTCSSP